MKLKKLPYLLLFIMSIFLFSCESEEDDSGIIDSNDNNTSTSWADNYWKKSGEDVYIDLTSETPKFCSNGNPVPGTYSSLRWENTDIAFFIVGQTLGNRQMLFGNSHSKWLNCIEQ